jgi:hypothetical protein
MLTPGRRWLQWFCSSRSVLAMADQVYPEHDRNQLVFIINVSGACFIVKVNKFLIRDSPPPHFGFSFLEVAYKFLGNLCTPGHSVNKKGNVYSKIPDMFSAILDPWS